jgi:hypothetical protein
MVQFTNKNRFKTCKYMIYFVFVNGNMKAIPKFECLQHFYESSTIQLHVYFCTGVFLYILSILIAYQYRSETLPPLVLSHAIENQNSDFVMTYISMSFMLWRSSNFDFRWSRRAREGQRPKFCGVQVVSRALHLPWLSKLCGKKEDATK